MWQPLYKLVRSHSTEELSRSNFKRKRRSFPTVLYYFKQRKLLYCSNSRLRPIQSAVTSIITEKSYKLRPQSIVAKCSTTRTQANESTPRHELAPNDSSARGLRLPSPTSSSSGAGKSWHCTNDSSPHSRYDPVEVWRSRPTCFPL